MKTSTTAWLAALGASLAATPVLAVNGHYPPGIEGLSAAAAPPEGLYYRGYLLHYDIEDFNASSGTAVPGDNSGSVTALAHRFILMTGNRFLGALIVLRPPSPRRSRRRELDDNGSP